MDSACGNKDWAKAVSYSLRLRKFLIDIRLFGKTNNNGISLTKWDWRNRPGARVGYPSYMSNQ